MSKTYYITTPIYYVNDRPHIGHASTTVWADVSARYQRMMGIPTFFLTGVDEHGTKVQQAAEKRGLDPQKHCDEMAPQFEELWKRLSISHDDFVRTTQERHRKVVQQVLVQLQEKGQIYKKKYGGWYSKSAEQFVTEKEMVDGKFPSHYGEVIFLEEENYFFRMSAHQEWLKEYIAKHPEWIRPENRRNEILGALQRPLEDLCISRPKARLSWGIEIPFDQDYVTYVWVDALVNYISIPGYGTNDFDSFWPANYHLIAKDILTTHCIYWPTLLHALDLPMPNCVLAHGWWLFQQEKMSKSLGNVVNPVDLIGTHGADAVRYFICRELQMSNDTDFTLERFQQRFNADLANDYGNLVNRTINMIGRYRDSKVPAPDESQESDVDLLRVTGECLKIYHLEMNRVGFAQALEAIWKIVTRANRYVEENAPFKMAKDPALEKRLNTVLYHLAQTVARIGWLAAPFMPETAGKILIQVQKPDLFKTVWKDASIEWLAPGHQLGKAEPLFPRQEAVGKK